MSTFKLTMVALAFIPAACSDDTYRPIVDGPTTARYQQDLQACRQLSQSKEQSNDGRTGGAIVGGLIGAADADSGDAVEGLIAGAVIGGLLGSAEDSSEIKTERDAIVFQCLRGRGHKVVG